MYPLVLVVVPAAAGSRPIAEPTVYPRTATHAGVAAGGGSDPLPGDAARRNVLGAGSRLRGEGWPAVVEIGSVRLGGRAARDVRGRVLGDRVVGTSRRRRPRWARGAFRRSGLDRSPPRVPLFHPAVRLPPPSPPGGRL